MTNEIIRNFEVNDDDPALRPLSLSDFYGQSETLKNLSVFIRGAVKREEPLDHILFYGPPGLGKTTLARIISRELGVNFKTVAAPSISKPGDLAAILVTLEPRDVLFIDEIHRLPLIVEELLYGAMEDFKITVLVGDHNRAEPIEVAISPFTLVGATTRKGTISQPLNDRFGIQFRMDFYPPEDLFQIVYRACVLMKLNVSEAAVMEVARRSRGTPRIALRLVRRLRDFAHDEIGDELITQEFADKCLDRLGISEDGLDDLDQRYLHTLKHTFRGGPVGVETLASTLSESKETLEYVVEPYLIRMGYVSRTQRGRTSSQPSLL